MKQAKLSSPRALENNSLDSDQVLEDDSLDAHGAHNKVYVFVHCLALLAWFSVICAGIFLIVTFASGGSNNEPPLTFVDRVNITSTPSVSPSYEPSVFPTTFHPTKVPSKEPTMNPSTAPTSGPSTLQPNIPNPDHMGTSTCRMTNGAPLIPTDTSICEAIAIVQSQFNMLIKGDFSTAHQFARADLFGQALRYVFHDAGASYL